MPMRTLAHDLLTTTKESHSMSAPAKESPEKESPAIKLATEVISTTQLRFGMTLKRADAALLARELNKAGVLKQRLN